MTSTRRHRARRLDAPAAAARGHPRGARPGDRRRAAVHQPPHPAGVDRPGRLGRRPACPPPAPDALDPQPAAVLLGGVQGRRPRRIGGPRWRRLSVSQLSHPGHARAPRVGLPHLLCGVRRSRQPCDDDPSAATAPRSQSTGRSSRATPPHPDHAAAHRDRAAAPAGRAATVTRAVRRRPETCDGRRSTVDSRAGRRRPQQRAAHRPRHRTPRGTAAPAGGVRRSRQPLSTSTRGHARRSPSHAAAPRPRCGSLAPHSEVPRRPGATGVSRSA